FSPPPTRVRLVARYPFRAKISAAMSSTSSRVTAPRVGCTAVWSSAIWESYGEACMRASRACDFPAISPAGIVRQLVAQCAPGRADGRCRCLRELRLRLLEEGRQAL